MHLGLDRASRSAIAAQSVPTAVGVHHFGCVNEAHEATAAEAHIVKVLRLLRQRVARIANHLGNGVDGEVDLNGGHCQMSKGGKERGAVAMCQGEGGNLLHGGYVRTLLPPPVACPLEVRGCNLMTGRVRKYVHTRHQASCRPIDTFSRESAPYLDCEVVTSAMMLCSAGKKMLFKIICVMLPPCIAEETRNGKTLELDV